jgi:hypothetical protein
MLPVLVSICKVVGCQGGLDNFGQWLNRDWGPSRLHGPLDCLFGGCNCFEGYQKRPGIRHMPDLRGAHRGRAPGRMSTGGGVSQQRPMANNSVLPQTSKLGTILNNGFKATPGVLGF